MDFAERQLSKHGWVKGQGLGKSGNGISEAIKVKLKRDNSGVGSAPGSEFTSNWWDLAFNSAAKGIQVTSNQDEVVVKTDQDSSASLKKRHYDSHRKELKYGGFLNSTCTQLQQEVGVVREVHRQREGSNSTGEQVGGGSEEVVEGVKVVDDAVLLRACAGRTAHKGARHGLTLSGKLARIEQQESTTTDGAMLSLLGETGAKLKKKVGKHRTKRLKKKLKS